MLEQILKVLKEARNKFDFSTALICTGKLAIKEYSVYNSTHKGVKDVVFPANSNCDYKNSLVAIENNSGTSS